MRNNDRLRRWLVFSVAPLLVTLTFSCIHKSVCVGSPYERYDHNRSRTIVVSLEESGSKMVTRKVVDEVYRPRGSDSFPIAQYSGDARGTDQLPAANVVPVFTGVSLPLSDESVGEVRSDKSDLIDFLSDGPIAQTGVEPSETSGDHKAAEIAYGPILAFLGSQDQLTGDRNQLVAGLSSFDAEVGDEVIDSRYRLRAFTDVLAVKYQQFCFILYKVPGSAYYSRLVVVPGKIKGQDFSAKKP